MDVTCPFENRPAALNGACQGEEEKYKPVREHLLQKYQKVTVEAIIIGALGLWYPKNDRVMRRFCRLRYLWLFKKLTLLMCLMRLHLGLLYEHLARIFQISVSSVGNHMPYILSLLCKIMKKVVIWLPKSHIQNSMPDSFIENKHDDTPCILDCTEVFLQHPKKLIARAQTFSSYKAHNTVKSLVAIAPNGFIMFVSKAYGERASDKFIANSSGISDYLVRGDVMADRGFALTDEMQLQGVRLNTPAFTKEPLVSLLPPCTPSPPTRPGSPLAGTMISGLCADRGAESANPYQPVEPGLRCSTRERRPPAKFRDYVQ
ncbi:uncharacterized protein LOC142588186 [Dermacentor variabilis]|uniref:uncharacterized protein LOC142588186 n=1 Tax=Dermacentor variabilis TaxID=34621 RepID=UPI003F5B3296